LNKEREIIGTVKVNDHKIDNYDNNSEIKLNEENNNNKLDNKLLTAQKKKSQMKKKMSNLVEFDDHTNGIRDSMKFNENDKLIGENK